ncbi:MAG TPA: hypothetical protein VGP36_21465 [Mycobacteriales bacterium]|nr:hypothetical protein [Mycobacteriales bacterium]
MRTRSSVVRAQQLLSDGQAAIDAGDHAGSIPGLEQAAELGRAVLAEEPDQPRHRLALGAVCAALGEALASTTRYGEAVTVLTEALDAYGEAGPLVTGRVADVRLRRAWSYARLGAGASAVVDAQAAVFGQLRRGVHPDRVDGAYVDLARTMMLVSDLFGAWADPAVALAAAREGLSWYTRAVRSGAAEMDLALWVAMVRALSVESAVLRRTGAGEAAGPAEATLQWLGSAPVDTLTARRTLAPNVTTPTVADAVAELARPAEAGLPAEAGPAGAVGAAGDLAGLLLAEPLGPPCTPALRTSVTLLPAAAGLSAAGALRLLTGGRAETGLRLGLEAHYLYAATAEEGLLVPAAAARWAYLRAELGTQAAACGDEELAADLRT